MATDLKPSTAPAASALAGAELIPCTQGGASKALTPDQLKTYALATIGQLNVDNIRLDGNTISTTDVNGNLILSPNGTGDVVVDDTKSLLFSTVAGAPEIVRNSAGLRIRGNDGTYTNALIESGRYAQQAGSPSTFRGIEIGNSFQVAFSDGADYGRGLGAVPGAAGIRVTNGSTGIGVLEAAREVEASAAGIASPNLLLSTESRKALTNEGAALEAYNTLPSAAANYEFVFICQAAAGIRIAANTGDTIRMGGSVSASAGFIRSVVVGSTVALVAINATEWTAISIVGTWTVDT